MAQQKQRKQLILTNDKNSFTYWFQPIQHLQPNFKTNGIKNFMAQQKQRKKPILTDDKNIFTYCFEPIQSLQPNFKTDGIRNSMYTKYIGDNTKLRIFSFIPQQERIQPNFRNRTYRTAKHTNTTRTTKTTTSTWVSALTPSLCSYNWETTKTLEHSYSNFAINRPISYISSTVHQSRKTYMWLQEQFRTFHLYLHESVTR